MIEEYAYVDSRPELVIIPDEELQVAWQTNTEVPTDNVGELWRWVSHMGLVGDEASGGENGSGWGLPDSRWVPARLRTPATLDGTRPLAVGARVRDVAKDSYGEVVEIDHDKRTVLFKSDWPAKTPGVEPIRYTYRITLEEGWKGRKGSTIMKTEMRATNVPHARLMQMFGPTLDQKAMEAFVRTLTRRADPERAAAIDRARYRKRVGTVAAIGAGVAVWKLATRNRE